MDENAEIFVIHIIVLSALSIPPSRKVKVGLWLADKNSIKVPIKYSDYVDIFLPNLAIGLPKHTSIENHIIKLDEGKQLSYGRVYSLD